MRWRRRCTVPPSCRSRRSRCAPCSATSRPRCWAPTVRSPRVLAADGFVPTHPDLATARPMGRGGRLTRQPAGSVTSQTRHPSSVQRSPSTTVRGAATPDADDIAAVTATSVVEPRVPSSRDQPRVPHVDGQPAVRGGVDRGQQRGVGDVRRSVGDLDVAEPGDVRVARRRPHGACSARRRPRPGRARRSSALARRFRRREQPPPDDAERQDHDAREPATSRPGKRRLAERRVGTSAGCAARSTGAQTTRANPASGSWTGSGSRRPEARVGQPCAASTVGLARGRRPGRHAARARRPGGARRRWAAAPPRRPTRAARSSAGCGRARHDAAQVAQDRPAVGPNEDRRRADGAVREERVVQGAERTRDGDGDGRALTVGQRRPRGADLREREPVDVLHDAARSDRA